MLLTKIVVVVVAVLPLPRADDAVRDKHPYDQTELVIASVDAVPPMSVDDWIVSVLCPTRSIVEKSYRESKPARLVAPYRVFGNLGPRPPSGVDHCYPYLLSCTLILKHNVLTSLSDAQKDTP